MSKEQEIINMLKLVLASFQELPNVPPVDHERFKYSIDVAFMIIVQRQIRQVTGWQLPDKTEN